MNSDTKSVYRRCHSSLPLAISLQFNTYFSISYGVVIGWTSLNKAMFVRYNDPISLWLQPICYCECLSFNLTVIY